MAKIKVTRIEDIGDLRELRKNVGVSLRGLGRKTDIDYSFLCKVENGTRKLNEVQWDKIKKILKI